jgi:hypothetical protein
MESESSALPPEERNLAAQMPDPSGPPVPVRADEVESVDSTHAGDPVLRAIAALGVCAVALGGLMFPTFTSVGHTCGATRSAKLQWQARDSQIEEALRKDSASQIQTPPSEDEK